MRAPGTRSRPAGPAALLPRPVLACAAVGFAVVVALPLAGLLARAPWSSLAGRLGQPEIREALRLSLVVSGWATVIAVVLGLPLALVLARTTFPGQRLVRALVVLPMVLPPVVGGVALLLAFGRRGLVGGPLDDVLGITLPFTTAGAVLAAAFVATPFLVMTVEGALRSVDTRLEEATATLGAGAWRRLWHVTLPSVRPALGAGIALAWARALGEFGATITFAGNFPGRTQTTPLAVFLALESDRDAAVALSLVLLGVSVLVLVLAGGRLVGRPRPERGS